MVQLFIQTIDGTTMSINNIWYNSIYTNMWYRHNHDYKLKGYNSVLLSLGL